MLSLLTNSAANTALRNLNENSEATKSSIARMSSGSRIAKPSDDAASLAISNRLSADISSLEQAGRNAAQANSMLSVGNGAYDRIGDMLNRMKTLATQSINDTLTASERSFAQAEFDQLRTQITETAVQTRFNGQSLLTGGAGDVTTNGTIAGGPVAASLDLGNSNAFGGGGSVTSSGYVNGTVSDVSVEANGTAFDVSLTVGDQTFTGTLNPTAGTAQTLTSTTDGANTISITADQGLNYDGSAAGTIDDARTNLRVAFGLDDGTNTVFNAASNLSNAAVYGGIGGSAGDGSGAEASFSASASTDPGVYQLTYDASSTSQGGTFKLTNGVESFTADVAYGGDGDVQTVTFDNGVSFTLQSGDSGTGNPTDGDDFNFAADITSANAVRFSVDEGSNVSVNFQVGAQASDQVQFAFTSSTAEALGLNGQTVSTVAGAEAASTAIDSAIQTVNTAQAELGATMSRFEQIQGTIGTTLENLQAAKSSFNDVDMAKEMSEFTKNQTLQQASIAMLSQANQMPQQVLRLIQ